MCTFELLYFQLLLVFPSYCRTGRFVPKCFTVSIVTLFSACAARAGSIVLQFLVFSAIAGAARFPFTVSALKRPISR